MIQLDENQAIVSSWPELQSQYQEFKDNHCVVIPDVLAPGLREKISLMISRASFQKQIHKTEKNETIIGEELSLSSSEPIYVLLYFLLNSPGFLVAIRTITDYAQIQSVSGRIYKFDASEDCYDTWHPDLPYPGEDISERRLVGISINLSTEMYTGGHFLIRDSTSKEIYKDVYYQDWGTAHIFNIDEALEHRVTSVEGPGSRTVFAGWFFTSRSIYSDGVIDRQIARKGL